MHILPSVVKTESLHNRGSRPSDGQVIKGKVLQLLNAEEAIVEINGRAIKASIEVPLKPGASYLFQVFREPEGFHLKMIKEVGTQELTNNESVDATVKFLGLPADGRSKALVRLFLQHDWPLKTALLTQARRLIDLSGNDRDWEAIKTILEKKWPLKESLFKALDAVQNKQTSKFLNALLSELNDLNLASPAQQELATLLENWPTIEGNGNEKTLFTTLKDIGNDSIKEKTLEKWLTDNFPEQSETIRQAWPEAHIILGKMNTPKDLKIFLNLLGLSNQEENVNLKMATSSLIKPLTDPMIGQWMKDIFAKTGYFYEAELKKMASGGEFDTNALRQSLKGLLITLSQNGQIGGDTFQQQIHHLLQHINGQQLQSLHVDRSFLQLLFTFPLRFHDGLRDVHLFWEGKRKSDGSVDPDYCKMAFQLDLPHLNQTILHILIQEKRVTLSIFNDKPFVEALVMQHSPSLADKLREIGYNLVSIKQQIGRMPEAEAIFSVKAGKMDVRI